MSMWPQLFLCRTIIERCWPGVLKLHSSEVSWLWGVWYAQIFEKINFSRKLVLSWRRREDSASRTDILREFFQGKRYKKPFWDRNGQDCGIISDNMGMPDQRRDGSEATLIGISGRFKGIGQ
jgi:hypothetical protein